jgi:uncharacterized membrane protein (DUF485 family)
MIKKGIHANPTEFIRKQQRFAVIISNIFLFVGAIVVVSSLIFLLINLDQSDSLVTRLIPFFVSGLGFIICSQLIKRPNTKRRL